jgi:hypothetical protein
MVDGMQTASALPAPIPPRGRITRAAVAPAR